jgi:hypothetical protein
MATSNRKADGFQPTLGRKNSINGRVRLPPNPDMKDCGSREVSKPNFKNALAACVPRNVEASKSKLQAPENLKIKTPKAHGAVSNYMANLPRLSLAVRVDLELQVFGASLEL